MTNKENVKKWVDALLSGEYQQGYGKLCVDGKYCCLGVACEVAISNGVNTSKNVGPGSFRSIIYYGSSADTLPDAVMSWLGLDERDPRLHYTSKGWITATTANDDLGWDFSRIAAYVKRRYLDEEDSELSDNSDNTETEEATDNPDISGHVGSSDDARESS